MTAEEFLRDLALRVEVIEEHVPEEVFGEPLLVIRIDGHDADEFLSLTGVRIE